MRCGRIPNGGKLMRHSIRPNGFRQNRFTPQGLIKFYPQGDGSLLASLAWERFFPTMAHIHGYGCRIALQGNEGLRARGEYDEKRRRVYCGGYQLTARSVRSLVDTPGLEEIASADVIHHPENDEIAHTDLRITFGTDPPNLLGTMTAIMDRLWVQARGPLTHVCDCDRDIQQHPNGSLAPAPAGAYLNNRVRFLHFWRIVRMKLCGWVYRRFRRSRRNVV